MHYAMKYMYVVFHFYKVFTAGHHCCSQWICITITGKAKILNLDCSCNNYSCSFCFHNFISYPISLLSRPLTILACTIHPAVALIRPKLCLHSAVGLHAGSMTAGWPSAQNLHPTNRAVGPRPTAGSKMRCRTGLERTNTDIDTKSQ